MSSVFLSFTCRRNMKKDSDSFTICKKALQALNTKYHWLLLLILFTLLTSYKEQTYTYPNIYIVILVTLIADNEIVNAFYAVHLKTPNTHGSIKRNESGILYTYSAGRYSFKTSHCLAFWYRITLCRCVL
jgi:hypothetical protein